jgi:ankyrin repeat protein
MLPPKLSMCYRRVKGRLTALDRFEAAAKTGDLKQLQKSIDDVNLPMEVVFNSGVTPLATAAVAGRIDAMRLLTRHGARPEGTIRDGRTVQEVAIASGQVDAVVVLIDLQNKLDVAATQPTQTTQTPRAPMC